MHDGTMTLARSTKPTMSRDPWKLAHLVKTRKKKTVLLSASIVSITVINLRPKLLFMYIIKRIMKFKLKKGEKRALFLRINSITAYLQRGQFLASVMRSTPFEMNICKLRSVLAYQGEELWVDSMLNDQNLKQYWRCDFRMIQDTFPNIVRAVQPALRDIFSFGMQSLSKNEFQLHYRDFEQAALFILLQRHLQPVNQRLFKLLENFA